MTNVGDAQDSAILPEGVFRLDMSDYQSTHSRFWNLCRQEPLQIWTGKCVDFIFPKETLATRAIPFHIMPLDRHASVLDSFFQKHSPTGVDLWSVEGYHYGTYRGRYDREFRGWAAGELPFGTFCILAVDVDLVQISFKDFEFTLLAGSKSLIDDLEQRFGGAAQMKREFLSHLDSGEFGSFTPGAPEWGAEYVLPVCGWDSPLR